jgi:hypothetical protein
MERTQMQKKVDRALDAAVFENGYTDLMTQGADEVATDLCTYDEEFEGLDGEELGEIEKCVADYQKWYWSPENADRTTGRADENV